MSVPRETSLQAYADLVASGVIGDRQLMAWATLQAHGPMTGRELDDAAEVRGLWKRLSELKSLGLVSEHGVRQCRITNRRAVVWRHTTPEGELPKKVASRVPKPTYWLAVTATGRVEAAGGGREFVEKVARQTGAELVKVCEVRRWPVTP